MLLGGLPSHDACLSNRAFHRLQELRRLCWWGSRHHWPILFQKLSIFIHKAYPWGPKGENNARTHALAAKAPDPSPAW